MDHILPHTPNRSDKHVRPLTAGSYPVRHRYGRGKAGALTADEAESDGKLRLLPRPNLHDAMSASRDAHKRQSAAEYQKVYDKGATMSEVFEVSACRRAHRRYLLLGMYVRFAGTR